MKILPSTKIQQNYDEIAEVCKTTGEPVYLTKDDVVELVVMDIESFKRREQMLKLKEELLAVEEDRIASNMDSTLEEIDEYLDRIVSEEYF